MTVYSNSPPSGAILVEKDYADQLVALAGIVSPGVIGEDFARIPGPSGWSGTATGGASIAKVAGISGGVTALILSATGGAVCTQATSLQSFVADSRVDKWGFAQRQKIPLARTTNTRIGSGLLNTAATRSVLVGSYGNGPANFCVQFDGLRAGTFLDLGVAVDTNFHIFKVWHPGDGRVYAQMDGSQIFSVAMTLSLVDAYAYAESNSNSIAEDAQMQRDWCVYVFGR